MSRNTFSFLRQVKRPFNNYFCAARKYALLRTITVSAPKFSEPSQADHPGDANKDIAKEESKNSRASFMSVMELALGTVLGLGLLGIGGAGYLAFYKWQVLRKMENAFEPGFDPVLQLENASDGSDTEQDPDDYIRRPEQDLIDDIVHGRVAGHYYLLLGPKGAGKTSMIIDAMKRNSAHGVAMCDSHEHPEIFRLRFGKCLDFEFMEDWYGGLFQRKEPRDAGPLLDIERAMNKLEKVAIRYRKKYNRPLCLIFNNIHYIRDDQTGAELIHLLQQRAESWAASGVMSMIFSTDDRWVYDRMKQHGSRLEVVTVGDLNALDAIKAITASRKLHWNEEGPNVTENARELYRLVGGRLSYLGKLVKKKDMVQAAKDLIAREAAWINTHTGLIEDCDDDVMDEQKFSYSSWLLFAEFVRQVAELEVMGIDPAMVDTEYDVSVGYRDARQVMTRADFLHPLDHLNLVSIDMNHRVRPDSIMLLNAMRMTVEEKGFAEKLENVMDRVSAIESLGRTRELVWKMGPEEGAVARVKIER